MVSSLCRPVGCLKRGEKLELRLSRLLRWQSSPEILTTFLIPIIFVDSFLLSPSSHWGNRKQERKSNCIIKKIYTSDCRQNILHVENGPWWESPRWTDSHFSCAYDSWLFHYMPAQPLTRERSERSILIEEQSMTPSHCLRQQCLSVFT